MGSDPVLCVTTDTKSALPSPGNSISVRKGYGESLRMRGWGGRVLNRARRRCIEIVMSEHIVGLQQYKGGKPVHRARFRRILGSSTNIRLFVVAPLVDGSAEEPRRVRGGPCSLMYWSETRPECPDQSPRRLFPVHPARPWLRAPLGKSHRPGASYHGRLSAVFAYRSSS